jgi:uncharacterized membrane protein (DUF373 family)
VDRFYAWGISIVINVLIVVTALALIYATIDLTIALIEGFGAGATAEVKTLILGVLTIFIIIEIFDLFREYLHTGGIRVSNLAEVSLAVVFRELWLKLLEGSNDAAFFFSLAAVIAVLALLWYLSGGMGARLSALRGGGAPERKPGVLADAEDASPASGAQAAAGDRRSSTPSR